MGKAREEFNQALARFEEVAGNIDTIVSSLEAKRREFRDVRLSVLNAGRNLGLDAATMGLILSPCERSPQVVLRHLLGLWHLNHSACERPPQMAELVGKACANLRSNVEVRDRAVQRRAS